MKYRMPGDHAGKRKECLLLCCTFLRSRSRSVVFRIPMPDHSHSHRAATLAGLVQEQTGISVARCYQCGKCSAGCPASSEMDFSPNVILRLLQTGTPSSDTKVLGSYTLWLCLSCHTCVTRCPMEIDLPTVMDTLRQETLRRHLVHPRAKDIVAFHKSFLNTVSRFGRLWEVGLVAEYKLRTRHFFQDVGLVPAMLKRGKLPLLPHFPSKRQRKEAAQ
jgi:heterodisulfide reductase subunit C2